MRQKFGSAKQRFKACLRTAAFLSIACAISPCLAEDAVTEALIQRGIELRRNSADAEALAVFLEAEKQDPKSVRVLLHVVTAAQAAGKWLLADSYMRKVSELSDDPYYRRHADAIDVVRRSIAARVGSFQAQGAPDGATVRLDGRIVGTLPMTMATSVEAGAYVMEVHKPGFYRLRRNVTITGGVLTREPVELNPMPARADVAGASALPGDGRTGSMPGAERAWYEEPAVGWTLLGVGVASGITSGITLAIRESRARTWNSEDECVPADGTTREDACGNFKRDAETFQTIGVVTGIAGVALAGAGVALLLAGGDDEEAGVSSAPGISDAGGLKLAGCGAGLLSIACHGSF